MSSQEWINISAIIVSPIVAVVITLWHQGRAEKRNIKKTIFFALMKHRGSTSIPTEYVDALNSIDYVFHDSEKIKNNWAELYDNYRAPAPDYTKRLELQVSLIMNIAQHLGYKKLTHTQISKYYTPQLYENEKHRVQEVSDEFLRVLKASESFSTKKDEGNNPPPSLIAN